MKILTRPCSNSNMLKNRLSWNCPINIKDYLVFSKLKISNRTTGQSIFRIFDNPAHVTRHQEIRNTHTMQYIDNASNTIEGKEPYLSRDLMYLS